MILAKLHRDSQRLASIIFFKPKPTQTYKTRITGNTGINKGKQNGIYFYGIYFSNRLDHD